MKILHMFCSIVLSLFKCGKWEVCGMMLTMLFSPPIQLLMPSFLYCKLYLPHEHALRMASIFWSLWKHKNFKLWKDENEMCANVVDRAPPFNGWLAYYKLPSKIWKPFVLAYCKFTICIAARWHWCFCFGENYEIFTCMPRGCQGSDVFVSPLQWLNDMQFDNVDFVVD